LLKNAAPADALWAIFYEKSSNDGEEMSRKTDLGLERRQVEGSP
jgi:hypothetical protein